MGKNPRVTLIHERGHQPLRIRSLVGFPTIFRNFASTHPLAGDRRTREQRYLVHLWAAGGFGPRSGARLLIDRRGLHLRSMVSSRSGCNYLTYQFGQVVATSPVLGAHCIFLSYLVNIEC